MAVKKEEFICRMAETGGITKKEARRGYELFLETLTDCLREDETVKIYGFGKFGLKKVKEKPARNPWTGEPCIVPEHKKVKFYAGEGLPRRMERSK